MYLEMIYKYLFGYLRIKVEGFNAEKVINKIINRKIFLWNIKRDKTTIVYFNIGIKDFKNIYKIIKQDKCQTKIINKKGLPFILHRYRKRKILGIIVVLLIFIPIVLSHFIWNIEIQGIDKLNKEEITRELEEEGLKVGVLKHRIDTDQIINKIRYDRSDISWIGIELNGTNAIVKIVEADEKPEIINNDDYCNIVSNKDAQIIKISAQSGIPLVKEGDIVTKNQVLIAGWMEGKYTGTRYVHSEGNVIGKVWYKKKEKIYLTQTITENTGRTETKYQIKFNNFNINLYKTLSNFKKYDTIYENKKLKIFSNFYLPIEIIKITNCEQTVKQITYGIEDAKQIGIEKLSKELEEEIGDTNQVLQKFDKSYAYNDYIEIELVYEVQENIGTKEKIVF